MLNWSSAVQAETRCILQIRMQFLSHLRRLTSAAQSINKVVSFLLKHSSQAPTRPGRAAASHSEADLWECILEELEKSSINAKINIFYMLDSLLDQSLAMGVESYRELVKNDLEKVVNLTVPRDTREGVLNRMSTLQVGLERRCLLRVMLNFDIALLQVLQSWQIRRLFPGPVLEALLQELKSLRFPTSSVASQQVFSRNDILRRIEDDRERHKRLRERIWVLPVPPLVDLPANPKLSTVLGTTASNSPASPASPAATEPKLVSLAGYAKKEAQRDSNGDAAVTAKETALDVEFEQAWNSVSESYRIKLEDADLQAMERENARCFG